MRLTAKAVGRGQRLDVCAAALVFVGLAMAPHPSASAPPHPKASTPHHPKASAHYTGSGDDYLNNTPRWLHEADGHISFKTSATGMRILDFKGTASFSCDAASHYVTARYILVKPDGSFAYRFNFPTKDSIGQPYGREYVAIYGRFLGDGRSASVSYFVDAVVPEKPVARPYDTTKPASLGCASWVRATVRARRRDRGGS